jgi:hypothetical protein
MSTSCSLNTGNAAATRSGVTHWVDAVCSCSRATPVSVTNINQRALCRDTEGR